MKRFLFGKSVPVTMAALFASGCFSYRALEVGAVPEGDAVRLHLTGQGLVDLPELPVQGGSALKGTLMRWDDEQLLVRVRIAEQQDGLLTRDLGRDVAIPASRIARLERRELNRFRTGLAVAGGAGIVAVLLRMFSDVHSEGDADPMPHPAEMTRVPPLTAPLLR